RTPPRSWLRSLARMARARRAHTRGQGLIDGHEHLSRRELIEAAAIALEGPFAAQFLAGQAGLRVLHDPAITPAPDWPGGIPRPFETSNRPGTDQPRTGRAIKGNGRATTGGCEVGRGRIRSDVYGGFLEQLGKGGPVEL